MEIENVSLGVVGPVPKSVKVINLIYLYTVNKAGYHRSLVFFQGVHTRIPKETYSFVIFQTSGGGGVSGLQVPSQDPHIKRTMCLIAFFSKFNTHFNIQNSIYPRKGVETDQMASLEAG